MHVHLHGEGGPQRVLKISLGMTLAYIVLLVVAQTGSYGLAGSLAAASTIANAVAAIVQGRFLDRLYCLNRHVHRRIECADLASSSKLMLGSICTFRSGLKYSTGTFSFSAKNCAV